MDKRPITILVIEAGDDDRNDPRVYDPYNAGEVYGSNLDWSYPTDQNRTMDASVGQILIPNLQKLRLTDGS